MNPIQIEQDFSFENSNIDNEYEDRLDQLNAEFNRKKIENRENYLSKLLQYKRINSDVVVWKVCGPYEEYKNVEYENILIIYTSEEKAKTVLENSEQRIIRTTISELYIDHLKFVDDFTLEKDIKFKKF